MQKRALLGAVVFGAVALLVPSTPASDKDGKIDWVGAYLGVGGLILFNFVWKYVVNSSQFKK